MQQPWAVPCQKNNTARSHAGNAQEGQGGIATAHARTYPRARGLAQASGQRLLRLPCRADQRPCTGSILLSCDAHLVAHPAAARPEGPLLMATNARVGRRLAPPTAYPSPVSRQALRRHAPEVGAVCGNSACTDLGGGRPAMTVPTALQSEPYRF